MPMYPVHSRTKQSYEYEKLGRTRLLGALLGLKRMLKTLAMHRTPAKDPAQGTARSGGLAQQA
jgi:hypothetical protein